MTRTPYNLKNRHFHNSISLYPDVNIAVKAMNDTIGEILLVTSRLVFGIIPRFPIIAADLPTQKERTKALGTAQVQMNTIIAQRKTGFTDVVFILVSLKICRIIVSSTF